jgi:hypothetical protein
MREFLCVKILIDLYKPLLRGCMLKFDGKSTLIGFKFERLPKFFLSLRSNSPWCRGMSEAEYDAQAGGHPVWPMA